MFAVQTAINGITLGAIYAIIASGFAIVYSVLRMMHFAHGDTYMFGMFVVYGLLGTGLPIGVAILIGVAVAALLAVITERGAYRFLRESHPIISIVAAVAAASVIRGVVILVWGVRTRPFPAAIPGSISLGHGIVISGNQMLSIGIALILAIGMREFLHRNRWGQALLLLRQDRETAALMGVPVNTVIAMVYALAGVVGIVGGFLYCSQYGVIDPMFGFQQTLTAFVAAVLGGLGGIGGAVVGGLTLGILEQFSAGYISSAYAMTIAFAVMVVVLLFRPEGITGRPIPGERV